MSSRSFVICFAVATGLLHADPAETDRAPVEPKTLPAPDQPVAPASSPVKELDADRTQVGEVILNKKTREIRFPAEVNMRDGEILEFALVHANGKIHESLLLTQVSAIDLNVAFKLLRYQASPEFYAEWEPSGALSNRFPEVKPEVKEAARIDIGVEWEEEGKIRKAKINECISHGSTGETMPADPWVYGGSMIYKDSYLAQSTGDLAAIFITNAALINYSGKDNKSDEVWFPFPKRVPPEGTKVTIIITPHKKPAEKP
jgi:hypothetical protein